MNVLHTGKGLFRAEGEQLTPLQELPRGATVVDTTETVVGVFEAQARPGLSAAQLEKFYAVNREALSLPRDAVDASPFKLHGEEGDTRLATYRRGTEFPGVAVAHAAVGVMGSLPETGERVVIHINDTEISAYGFQGRTLRGRVTDGVRGDVRTAVGNLSYTLTIRLPNIQELVLVGDPTSKVLADLVASYAADPATTPVRVITPGELLATPLSPLAPGRGAARSRAGRGRVGERALPWGPLAAAAAVGLVLGLAPALVVSAQVGAQEAHNRALLESIAEFQPQLEEHRRIGEELATIETNLQRAEELERGMVAWAPRLERLVGAMPRSGGSYAARFETLAATTLGTVQPRVSYEATLRAASQADLIAAIAAFETPPFDTAYEEIRRDEEPGRAGAWSVRGTITDTEEEPVSERWDFRGAALGGTP